MRRRRAGGRFRGGRKKTKRTSEDEGEPVVVVRFLVPLATFNYPSRSEWSRSADRQ